MDNLESWKVFESTGKVEDYLKYADERRLQKARENFLSVIEGGQTDDRKNYSGGNGNFRDAYK